MISARRSRGGNEAGERTQWAKQESHHQDNGLALAHGSGSHGHQDGDHRIRCEGNADAAVEAEEHDRCEGHVNHPPCQEIGTLIHPWIMTLFPRLAQAIKS